ncbi:MAG: DegV family protein [Erysipelotrichaceae bacterium]|nr:DegV family protein [Erysipelotrichaceae bacterium]
MNKYIIFTDSCSDLSTELRQKNNLEYVRMGLVVDGEEKHADLDWVEYKPEEFYGWMVEGKTIKTTQVSLGEFIDCFAPFLEKEFDILYIGCSSKLTGSLNVFKLAKEELLRKYPSRRIESIDSLTASGCLGMLVVDSALQRDKGLNLDELISWVQENKLKYNQFATVEDLNYIKNAGRIKGSKAFMGNLFHKKPIFISDAHGDNYTLGTVTGTKNADKILFDGVAKTIDKTKCQTVVVSQGMAMDRALRLKKRFEEELGVKAEIWWVGPIIGTTCGPGVLATFCYGKEVTRYDGDEIGPSLEF